MCPVIRKTDAIEIKISNELIILLIDRLRKSNKIESKIICGMKRSKLKRFAYSKSINGKESMKTTNNRVAKIFF
jgi:hypothetical protein